ncbi:MAG: hypothetical protein IJU06_05930, partial [Oscillospiraceae bacterium]|nr:hypothetical protein [Oscillospiraceae bacterium]
SFTVVPPTSTPNAYFIFLSASLSLFYHPITERRQMQARFGRAAFCPSTEKSNDILRKMQFFSLRNAENLLQ